MWMHSGLISKSKDSSRILLGMVPGENVISTCMIRTVTSSRLRDRYDAMRVRRSPPLARTRRRIMGRRGYFGKAGSAADRWQSQKVGASIGRQEAAGASKLSRQQPAAFQAAVSSSRVGAFCFNTRMNSRIQAGWSGQARADTIIRSEEHTSELQSHLNLVCRLLLEK